MGDVEELCKRVIFIDHGRLLFDGSLAALVERFLPYKTLHMRLRNGTCDLSSHGEVIARSGDSVTLRVSKRNALNVIAHLVSNLQIQDLTVSDPPVSDVVKHIYALNERSRVFTPLGPAVEPAMSAREGAL
jgi:ABC-2 type transport system ATP-binding protein